MNGATELCAHMRPLLACKKCRPLPASDLRKLIEQYVPDIPPVRTNALADFDRLRSERDRLLAAAEAMFEADLTSGTINCLDGEMPEILALAALVSELKGGDHA